MMEATTKALIETIGAARFRVDIAVGDGGLCVSNGETKLDQTNGGGYAMNTNLMMLFGGLMLMAAAGWVWLKRTK
ncbi:MAG: LPXTG cell wall anchor domain-containing protein [Planctomycetota bacterium]|nr:LPXTG cell wall anchor domain-containing protein [Planctomycetota bacterium]